MSMKDSSSLVSFSEQDDISENVNSNLPRQCDEQSQ